jgi:hypothetical protein
MAPKNITADVGGTKNVIGSRIATPLTEPRPGIAPINKPTVAPKITNPKFSGWKLVAKPSANRLKISIFYSFRFFILKVYGI